MTPTRLHKPGVYLLRPPALVTAEIDRELLVLFCVRFPKVTGAVLYDPSGSQDIGDLLTRCLNQFEQLEIPSEHIKLKICGLSQMNVGTISRVNKWIQSQPMTVVAADIGRFVKREIKIDTETGALGVKALHTRPQPTKVVTDSRQQARRGW